MSWMTISEEEWKALQADKSRLNELMGAVEKHLNGSFILSEEGKALRTLWEQLKSELY